jgi:hypothetical protein
MRSALLAASATEPSLAPQGSVRPDWPCPATRHDTPREARTQARGLRGGREGAPAAPAATRAALVQGRRARAQPRTAAGSRAAHRGPSSGPTHAGPPSAPIPAPPRRRTWPCVARHTMAAPTSPATCGAGRGGRPGASQAGSPPPLSQPLPGNDAGPHSGPACCRSLGTAPHLRLRPQHCAHRPRHPLSRAAPVPQAPRPPPTPRAHPLQRGHHGRGGRVVGVHQQVQAVRHARGVQRRGQPAAGGATRGAGWAGAHAPPARQVGLAAGCLGCAGPSTAGDLCAWQA